MKILSGRTIKKGFLLVLAAAVLLFSSGTVLAEEQTEYRVLRVGVSEVDGFTEMDADGNRHGIVIDYLNEIAKYTGWKYEYIDTAGDNLIKEFMAGQYDLIGGTYYLEGMEEYFGYPVLGSIPFVDELNQENHPRKSIKRRVKAYVKK